MISISHYKNSVKSAEDLQEASTKTLLDQVIAYIKENINTPELSVELLADNFNMSHSSFHRHST